MTAEERIEYWKKEWRRQIISVTGDEEEADQIIELAYLNGLFEPLLNLPQSSAMPPPGDQR